MQIDQFDDGRMIRAAKWTFSTRCVRMDEAVCLNSDVASAKSGDLVLARVQQIGSNERVQLRNGRPAASTAGPCHNGSCRAALDGCASPFTEQALAFDGRGDRTAAPCG